MAFTLEDLLALPDDVQPEHAVKAGLTVPPPPALAPGPQPPAPIATAAPAAAPPGPPAPIIPIDGTRFFSGASKHPNVPVQPMPAAPNIDTLPGGVGPNAGLGSVEATSAYTTLPKLNFKQREALPTTSAGVAHGTSQYEQNLLDREQEKDKNPWGSAENHPGWLGKLAHGAAKAGNIALDVVDPAAAAAIPETELGHRARESELFGKGQELKKSELEQQAEDVKERQEDTREQHEENMRERQLVFEKQGDEKIDALFEGLNNKEKQTANQKEKWLRGFGLKPNPDDPDGSPIDIPAEEISPKEQQQMSMLQALFHARQAKAAYDEYKANPESPQAQSALIRARAAKTSADAAAERAGIARSRYYADMLGEDENGQPLAGVELTDDGRPVGLAVTKANKTGGGDVTNTTRSMAEMARTVQPQIEKVQKEVTDLAASLGPAVGRWNDYMTNKGGADFPAFAGLDQDLDLLASAVVRTHFGARGGQGYREALRKNFGEAQSPEDLLARINAASSWIQGYAQADQVGKTGPKRHAGDNPPPKPAGGGATPTVPTRTNKKTGEVQQLVNGQWQTTKPKAAPPAQ
jgi:hypothetical protein